MPPRIEITRPASFNAGAFSYGATFVLDGGEFKSANPSSLRECHEINSALERLVDFVNAVAVK